MDQPEVATQPGVTQEAPDSGADSDILSRLSAIVDEQERSVERPEESREPEAQAEDVAQEESAPETPAVQTVRVKIDGEEKEVPLDHVVAKYQKDAAAEKRLEEASKMRREAEEAAQRANTERQQLLNAANTFIERAKQFGPKQPDIALLESDPVAYLRQEAEYKQAQQQLAEAEAAKAYLQQQEQQTQQARYAEYMQQEQQNLLKALPHWSDEAKAAKEKAMVAKHFDTMGFNKEQTGALAHDHRMIVMAREAALYRDLMSKVKEAPKAVAKAPQRVERPGVATKATDGRTVAMQRLSRSGRVEDAAAVFRSLLDSE